jgi:hypothetical protein
MLAQKTRNNPKQPEQKQIQSFQINNISSVNMSESPLKKCLTTKRKDLSDYPTAIQGRMKAAEKVNNVNNTTTESTYRSKGQNIIISSAGEA